MFLEKISLVNFKNYKQTDIELSPEVNCFIGTNGAGKTNLLDAVYYLSMCKSYLNPIDTQNIHFGESFFVIQGTWDKLDKKESIYCAVKKGTKKVFKKNKVLYDKLADHVGLFPTVMISPYDRNLILEGSDVRRKWMDGIIAQFDKDFLSDLIRYGKVLDQRNALLKNMSDFGFFNRESIEVWDEQLIKYGHKIHAARSAFLTDFIPIFQKYYRWLTDEQEEVGLEYKSQLLEGDFATLLKEAERKDFRKQYSTVGTHKDDLVFTIKEHPVKKFGSQGQQKSFLIALRLGQFDWLLNNIGVKPILLLDDIFDKLDNHRVERLMQMVSEKDFGQVLVTDTDRERVARIFENINTPFKAFEVKSDEIITEKSPQLKSEV